MTIHSDDAARAVDLAVPDTACLAAVLPSVVDIVHGDEAPAPPGGLWRLCRIGGLSLDDALTLRENGVRDGDLLWLASSGPPPPRWFDIDPTLGVARAETGHNPRWLSVAGSLAAAVTGAAALVWSASVTASGPLMTAVATSAMAFAGALVTGRTAAEPSLPVTLGAIASIFAAAAGGLAVPAGPASAHLLLAATAAFSVSTLLLRLMGCGIAALTALATGMLLTAVVSAAALAWHLNAAAAGAVLATLALAASSVAPRLSIAISRIAPAVPSVDGPGDSPPVREGGVEPAHDLLTGLVAGSALAAASGAVLVAVGVIAGDGSSFAATVFVTTITLVLLLRMRTHVRAARRSALAVGGFVSGAASVVTAVASAPQHGVLVSLPALIAAVAALVPLTGWAAGLRAHRIADVAECLALASVVPLACWVGDVYGLVRDLALR